MECDEALYGRGSEAPDLNDRLAGSLTQLVSYRRRMTRSLPSGVDGQDLTIVVHSRLSGYVDQLMPIPPYVGFYMLFEIKDAWGAFHNWMYDNSPQASSARLILGTDEEHDRDRREIVDQFLTWNENVPPDSGVSDSQHIAFAEESLHLLTTYLRHVAIHLRPETLGQEKANSFIRLRGRVNGLVSAQSLRDSLEDSKQATEDAKRAAEETRTEMAKLSAATLSKSYLDYSKSEGRFAWGFNTAAVSLVVVTIVVALKQRVPADYSLSQSIQHVAIFAIALGLAGYLAKQGSRHRTNATWSKVVSVQLSTLDSYLGPVKNDETRDKMRLLFANRAFGSAPDVPSTGDDFGWVQQIVSAIASNRGSS